MMDAFADPIADFFANPLVTTGLTLVGIAVVALWLAAAWWAYQDAARRTESTLAAFLAAGWIVLSTPLMLPIALAVYAFSRPQVTASDHRTRSLVRELESVVHGGAACPSCQLPVESAWLRCPSCSTWLSAPCRSCAAWSARDLEACPFCGTEDHAAPGVIEPHGSTVPASPGVAVGPGVPIGPGVPLGRAFDIGTGVAGHGTAAANASSAAAVVGAQERVASSARPFSYATSRDISSVSS